MQINVHRKSCYVKKLSKVNIKFTALSDTNITLCDLKLCFSISFRKWTCFIQFILKNIEQIDYSLTSRFPETEVLILGTK